MSSSAPSMPRQSSPVKVLLVIILGLGAALAGVLFFGPGGGFAATRAGIFSGSRPAPGMGEVPVQSPLVSETAMAAAEAPAAGRRGTGAATAAAPVDGTAQLQASLPPAVPAEPALAMNPRLAAQVGNQNPTGQYEAALPATAPSAAAPQLPGPQAGPAPTHPMASRQGLDPFLVRATGQPSTSPRGVGFGSPALVPTTAFPPATVPAATWPTLPDGYSGAATVPGPAANPDTPGIAALPLPPPQPSIPRNAFGLRCSDIPRDETSLRMGFLPIGALVLDVSAGSESALAGMSSGDRIVRAGGQPVVSASHFLFLTTQHKGGPLDVELIRGGVLYRATLGDAGSAPR